MPSPCHASPPSANPTEVSEATRDGFRRLISQALAKALARALSGELDAATLPFQFTLRAADELDPRATVVSVDGRSACDTISHATILAKPSYAMPSRRSCPSPALCMCAPPLTLLVGRRGIGRPAFFFYRTFPPARR